MPDGDQSAMLSNDDSPDIFRSLDGFGLIGTWSWNFETREQLWSPGLYRLLGLHPDIRADYSLLYRRIHPDDKAHVRAPTEVGHTEALVEQTFRIVREDGTLCTLLSRSETHFFPSGRPLRAAGVLADISDQEMLKSVRAAERRRSRAIFDAVGAFTSMTAIYPFQDFSEEFVCLVGLPKVELLEESTRPVVKDQRRHWRDYGRQLYLAGKVVHVQLSLILTNRNVVPVG